MCNEFGPDLAIGVEVAAYFWRHEFDIAHIFGDIWVFDIEVCPEGAVLQFVVFDPSGIMEDSIGQSFFVIDG